MHVVSPNSTKLFVKEQRTYCVTLDFYYLALMDTLTKNCCRQSYLFFLWSVVLQAGPAGLCLHSLFEHQISYWNTVPDKTIETLYLVPVVEKHLEIWFRCILLMYRSWSQMHNCETVQDLWIIGKYLAPVVYSDNLVELEFVLRANYILKHLIVTSSISVIL